MTFRATIRAFSCLCVLGLLTLLTEHGVACEPESYFLFRSEAQSRLDSLNTHSASDNAFERIVLMHNLAFHKDTKLREQAEELLEKILAKKKRTPLVRAYAGSLKMIRVSHRTTGSKIFRSINPLTKSPYAEGREGFKQISDAIASDTANTILRILRATAAAESADHLNEMFDSARNDLEWLQAHKEPTDSVCQFLMHLNWTKYYYKLAKTDLGDSNLAEAKRHIEAAIGYACTPVYHEWAVEWQKKVNDLLSEEWDTRRD